MSCEENSGKGGHPFVDPAFEKTAPSSFMDPTNQRAESFAVGLHSTGPELRSSFCCAFLRRTIQGGFAACNMGIVGVLDEKR